MVPVWPLQCQKLEANCDSFLHVTGIFLFCKGFLLTRLVLEHKSICPEPPIQLSDHGDCWLPKSFDKAVIIIIDALRYDFTIPQNRTEHYLNALTVLHETAQNSPQNAFLRPFIADPPTTTLQRLKGLTTGTLPTFVDAGSNFAGTAIEEDNLIAQLQGSGKKLVHLGDDTWHSLFPGYFDANLTRAYDSFNVWDLHTVDNGVTEHLMPLLPVPDKWDIIIGHYLGVDHAGHRYGPDHPAMAAKLRQMDEVIRQMIEKLSDDALLVIMGDHGMDAKGDHGGESDDEVEAALWMYSKKGIFGRSSLEYQQPPQTAKIRPVNQIDLVPTLSLLLGLPIPFNNLGLPIEEVFLGPKGDDLQRLAAAHALSGAQTHLYQGRYTTARGLDPAAMSSPEVHWKKASEYWNTISSSPHVKNDDWLHAFQLFSTYQREHLQVCKSLWARFDLADMAMGITILALSLFCLIHFASLAAGNHSILVPAALKRIIPGGILGVVFGRITSAMLPDSSVLDLSLLGGSLGSLTGYALSTSARRYSSLFPTTLWSWASIVFILTQSIGFASNSYTIWEDDILLFFLASFGFLALLSSIRQKNRSDRLLGIYHSILFLLLTRISSLSRLCREEQMPFCKSTFYASETSSTSAKWQLLIPYIVAFLLPSIIKSYYKNTQSYEGSASFWIGFCMRLGLVGSAAYWTLDAADNGQWFPSLPSEYLSTIKIHLAQILLVLTFAVGTATFIWAPPCIRILQSTTTPKKPITILGLTNIHASHYTLLYTIWHLALTILSKPMATGTLSLMSWQLFSLLEILSTNNLLPTTTTTTTQSSISPIGPTVTALLASFYFFKTGHTATLSSIQWDIAFLPFSKIHYPWSPLLVIGNNFAPYILAAVFIPLLALWKQSGEKRGLSSHLQNITATFALFLLYFATESLATTLWAGHLRRHLMLYRIFSPRFLLGAAVVVVVDVVGVCVAVGFGVWISMGAVGEVVGWG